MNFENSTLIYELREYSLDYLIPEHFTTDDSDEGIGHVFQYEKLDPMEPKYYSYLYDDEDDEDEDDEDEDNYSFEGRAEDHLWNLDSLLRAFDCDYLDYGEFLNTHVWDLFGITKNQFDLIDWEWIDLNNFTDFFEEFSKRDNIPSIEKRIKYSTVDTLTGYSTMFIDTHLQREDYLEYAERLIDTHSVTDCWDIFSSLSDYYRFYEDALEMNRRREEVGEPVFKYELTPKVAHLKDLHDKAFRDHQTMETERMKTNRQELNRKIKLISSTPDYTQFLFSSGLYTVLPVKSQEDLDEEGNVLRHCVASYGSYMARGDSYIYLIRKKGAEGIPYFTAEIIPAQSEKDVPKLKQCYTKDDKITKPDDLREFICEWARIKKFQVQCRI